MEHRANQIALANDVGERVTELGQRQRIEHHALHDMLEDRRHRRLVVEAIEPLERPLPPFQPAGRHHAGGVGQEFAVGADRPHLGFHFTIGIGPIDRRMAVDAMRPVEGRPAADLRPVERAERGGPLGRPERGQRFLKLE